MARTTLNVSLWLWLAACAVIVYTSVWLGPVHWWMWTMLAALGLMQFGERVRHSRPALYTPMIVCGGILAMCSGVASLIGRYGPG